MRIPIFLSTLLLAFSASAQTLLPARQVSVITNGTAWTSVAPTSLTAQASFDWIDLNWMKVSTNSWSNLFPLAATAQAAFDYVDDNWQPDLVVSSWSFLAPSGTTSQLAFDWLDAWFLSMGASNGFLKGTNIVNFTFDPATSTWSPPLDLVGVQNLAFVRDTNLLSTSAWTVETATNGFWDTNSLSWTTNASGTNVVAFISHPPFVTADGINFPSFVTKEEFYAILNAMGFANYDSYTYSATNYGSSTNVLANAGYQHWTVPAELLDGQLIGVHCWGGGGADGPLGHGGAGGYSYGLLAVGASTGDYNSVISTNGAVVVTNLIPASAMVSVGDEFCVQVGGFGGRAAVWRTNGAYNSVSNPLIVAGGGGGRGGNTLYDGANGGGADGLDAVGGGYGASESDGGAGGVGGGLAGTNIWGGAAVLSCYADRYSGAGGDGYHGGGSGGIGATDDCGAFSGGGGSGLGSADRMGSSYTTNSAAGAGIPPGTTETAYGLNAGYPNCPGRVAFEIQFNSWGK